MKKLAVLVAVAIIAGSSHAARSQEAFVVLRGERAGTTVRLAWELFSWPQDLRGFIVRWRPATDSGAPAGSWTSLQNRPITPGMWADKDLSNVEPDETRRRQLQADFQSLLREKKIQDVREPQFVATVTANPQVLRGLGREILADFRRAQLIGLGCVDRNVAPGRDREYGLFAVRASGRIDEQPAATFSAAALANDDARLKVDSLAVHERTTGTDLSWRFDETQAQRYSILAFNVRRADAGTTNFALVSKGAVAGPRVEGGWRYFTFADSSAVRDRRYTYAVVPVNVFGNELPSRTLVEYPSRAAVMAAPVLEDVRQTADAAVDVSWRFDAPQQASLKGFFVDRLELPQGNFAPVSPMLGPGERRFSDTSGKTNEAAYAYRVRAIGASGDERASALKTLVFVRQAVPPQPSSLTGVYAPVGGRAFVRLRWAAKPAADPVTDGYVVFADKTRAGVMSRQASVPLIRANEYYFEVPTLESRTYTIGIAGAARDGTVGPPAEVRVFVPGKLPASPTNLSIAPQAGGPIELRWQYPQDAPLRGFRVTVDRVVVADERQVASDARSWRLDSPTAGRTYDFEVTAVAREGVLSMPARIAFTVPARHELVR